MSILSELKTVLDGVGIPFEVGRYTGKKADAIIVITPMGDYFDLYADNAPAIDIQEARVSLFCRDNYTKAKKDIIKAFITARFEITDRRYINYESDTRYHHYVIDVSKAYDFDE